MEWMMQVPSEEPVTRMEASYWRHRMEASWWVG